MLFTGGLPRPSLQRVQLVNWTDDRIDDFADRMDAGFARGERQAAELRQELKGDIAGLRAEVKGDIAELRAEVKGDIAELRHLMLRLGTALIVVLLGAIAAGALSP